MKKRLLICLFILLIIPGCYKKDKFNKNINTIIEENKNILIGINYPITNISKLDKVIEKDIETEYNDFKEEYENFKSLSTKSELNIDYTFDLVNENYINIAINIFIDSSKLEQPKNKIKTYVFDIKNNKLLNLRDIIDEKNLKKLVNSSTNKLINNYKECIQLDKLNEKMIPNYDNFNLFTFDNNSIELYFNTGEISFEYCDTLNINIDFSNLDLLIKLEEESSKTINYIDTYPVNKVIDPNKKIVALTFDDGPSKYTDEIIETLHKNDAVGTFFVIGNKVKIYDNTLRKSVKYGNEIGNHSYNHKWLTKLSINELKQQIDKTQDIIYNVTGYKSVLLRPTYGGINSSIRNNTDLQIVMWSVDTMDWKYRNVNTIVKRATANVKDGDIILMHDIKDRTSKALKQIIPILKEKGFEFVTISELNEVKLLRQRNNNEQSK